jgi:tRNA G18 (ribose-2'-O)-methylase SpoU
MRDGFKIIAILHNIRSAYNVGSMFRSADALGIDKIYLGGYSPTPEHKKVVKTSLGAEVVVEWEYRRQTYVLLKELKMQGYQIIAVELDKRSVPLEMFVPAGNNRLAIMMGNEVRGLSNTMLDYADTIVEIPMQGIKESLNVSVAFAIAAYELRKKA